MKTRIALLLVLCFLLMILINACGPKPYYETSIGKEKLRYYNKTQYGLQPKKAPKF